MRDRPVMELPPADILLIWAALSGGGWCLIALVAMLVAEWVA
jgi:glycine/D-amino acid oxidase-like deaminating enzyme